MIFIYSIKEDLIDLIYVFYLNNYLLFILSFLLDKFYLIFYYNVHILISITSYYSIITTHLSYFSFIFIIFLS